MAVVFGTLGYRPKSLIPTLKSTPNVQKLVFYTGADKNDKAAEVKSAEARRDVIEYCRSIGIEVEAITLKDPFDFKGIATRIKQDIRRQKADGNEIAVFNIAGGTRPTSSAALLVCILEGIPTVYVHDVTYEEVRLPLLRIEYSMILSPEEREILKLLVQNKERPMSQVELASIAGKHKATVNHHVRNLIKKGVIRLDSHPKDSRKKVVTLEDSTELLLGDLN